MTLGFWGGDSNKTMTKMINTYNIPFVYPEHPKYFNSFDHFNSPMRNLHFPDEETAMGRLKLA